MSDIVLVYTRASESVGNGHAVRSVALANAATKRGLEVSFVLGDKETVNVLRDYGVNKFVDAKSISKFNVKYVIRDLPGENDPSEVIQEKKNGATVLLMDDKGPARTKASIVCDSMMTPLRAASLPQYSQTKYLYGLEYAVLKDEFLCSSPKYIAPSKVNQRIAIALGGGFNSGLLHKLLWALYDGGYRGGIDVLLTRASGNMRQLRAVADCVNAKLHIQSLSVYSIFIKSDLVITKLGISLLEAFSVGLPCILLEPTEMHLQVAKDLLNYYKNWPAIETGFVDDVNIDNLAAEAIALLAKPEQLRKMGSRALELVDGRGAQRLINEMIENKQ